jgi:hypothetical protein
LFADERRVKTQEEEDMLFLNEQLLVEKDKYGNTVVEMFDTNCRVPAGLEEIKAGFHSDLSIAFDRIGRPEIVSDNNSMTGPIYVILLNIRNHNYCNGRDEDGEYFSFCYDHHCHDCGLCEEHPDGVEVLRGSTGISLLMDDRKRGSNMEDVSYIMTTIEPDDGYAVIRYDYDELLVLTQTNGERKIFFGKPEDIYYQMEAAGLSLPFEYHFVKKFRLNQWGDIYELFPPKYLKDDYYCYPEEVKVGTSGGEETQECQDTENTAEDGTKDTQDGKDGVEEE